MKPELITKDQTADSVYVLTEDGKHESHYRRDLSSGEWYNAGNVCGDLETHLYETLGEKAAEAALDAVLKKKRPPLRLTVGKKGDHATYSANMIFDGEKGIAQVYGLPINNTLEDIHEAIASGDPCFKYKEALGMAYLLAAAPELVEALEEVLRTAYFHSNKALDAAMKARAALAKAKNIS